MNFAQEAEIVAKVVANIRGLGTAMVRDGCLDRDPGTLEDFARGFTQAKASFDFIDVGRGKERADSKIRGRIVGHFPPLAPHPSPSALVLISYQKLINIGRIGEMAPW